MFLKLLILFIFWNVLFSAFSDVKISITGGVDSTYPIAVIPFTWLNTRDDANNTLGNIDSIISADLRNCGKFNTISVSYLPHKPTKASEVIPMFWRELGINMIVLGSIDVNSDNNYIISYQLIDSSNNPALVILENQFLVEKKLIRYIAHTISNEIFEKLIGIKGIFCTRIAYVTYTYNSKYPYELCVADYDGYNQMSLCHSTEPLMSPAWSSDGKKIAYVTFASGRSELVVQTISTGVIENVINFPNHNGAPAFSPDGKKLAFSLSKTGSLNLYVIELVSGKILQITSNRHNNTEPSWFPDNQNLAYTSDQGGTPQIYKININKIDDIQRISWLYGSNCKADVSIDGSFLIMINRNQGQQNIAKLNLLTGQEELLTQNSFLSDTPTIAPNNTMVLYSTTIYKDESRFSFDNASDNQNESILELMSIDGCFKAHLKGSKNVNSFRFPAWSPLFVYS